MRRKALLQLAPLALAVIAQAPAGLIGSLLAADPGYQMVERGEDSLFTGV